MRHHYRFSIPRPAEIRRLVTLFDTELRRTLAEKALSDLEVYPASYVHDFIEAYVASFLEKWPVRKRTAFAHDYAVSCESGDLSDTPIDLPADMRAWREECTERRLIRWRYLKRDDFLSRGRLASWTDVWLDLESAHFAEDACCQYCGVSHYEDACFYSEDLLVESVVQQSCVACLSSARRYTDFSHEIARTELWHGWSFNHSSGATHPRLQRRYPVVVSAESVVV